jgi:hypothetical protein
MSLDESVSKNKIQQNEHLNLLVRNKLLNLFFNIPLSK